jgi:hypothetical protein
MYFHVVFLSSDRNNIAIKSLDQPLNDKADLSVVRPHIGDIIAYQHGLHFCQEVQAVNYLRILIAIFGGIFLKLILASSRA